MLLRPNDDLRAEILVLAHEYLDATGLDPRQAVELDIAADPDICGAVDEARLSRIERARLAELDQRCCVYVEEMAWRLWHDVLPEDAEGHVRANPFTPDQCDAATCAAVERACDTFEWTFPPVPECAAIRASGNNTAAAAFTVKQAAVQVCRSYLLGFRELDDERRDLLSRAWVTGTDFDGWLALRLADDLVGGRLQTVSEWLIARGLGADPQLRLAMHWALQESAEEAWGDEPIGEEQDAWSAPSAPPVLSHLGDRLVMPAQIVSPMTAPRLSHLLERVESGALTAGPDFRAVLATDEDAWRARASLADLSPMQVRAVCAVVRAFSSPGDDGRRLPPRLRVRARDMAKAAGVDPHNGRAIRELFSALEQLSLRRFPLAVECEDGDGAYVLAEITPLFRLRPIWSVSHDARRRRELPAHEIIAKWTARSRADGAFAPWDGPLPDHYDIELSELSRPIWHNLTLGADILDRLDRGAKSVRGRRESFTPLDWHLFISITQHIQHARGKSFIDRDGLIALHFRLSPDDLRALRARGRYGDRYVRQYEKAVKVLDSGGLARRERQDKPARRGGTRDVFALDPSLAPGIAASIEASAARTANAGRRRRRPRRVVGSARRGTRGDAEAAASINVDEIPF